MVRLIRSGGHLPKGAYDRHNATNVFDGRLRELLVDADLVFLSQEDDLLLAEDGLAIIVLSHVRQAGPGCRIG